MTDLSELTPEAVNLLKVQAKILEALELIPDKDLPSFLSETVLDAAQATQEALADMGVDIELNPFFTPTRSL